MYIGAVAGILPAGTGRAEVRRQAKHNLWQGKNVCLHNEHTHSNILYLFIVVELVLMQHVVLLSRQEYTRENRQPATNLENGVVV